MSCSKLKNLLLLCVFVGCSGESSPERTIGTSASKEAQPASEGLTEGLFDNLPGPSIDTESPPLSESSIAFADVAASTGLEFTFDNGYSKEKLMPAATSGGGAWLDFDRDGWVDFFACQGGHISERTPHRNNDQTFRNLFGEFENVSTFALPLEAEYSHGAVSADFDNDGFNDIYISNVGPDVLLHNLGDGTFRNVTNSAGTLNPLWAASAAFGDLDADGDLDIYVCNYVDYDPHDPITCLNSVGVPTTCHPRNVDQIPNRCFCNNGDGTFREVSDEWNLNADGSKSLGVVIADLNGDARTDVYVANDTEQNHLFLNEGSGFSENAVSAGCAMSGLGHLQASMGIAFGDYDKNGHPDLYVTHFIDDSNTLYSNLGNGSFTDTTRETELHTPTLRWLAFGCAMRDFDANGEADLFLVNGHIDDWRTTSGAPWRMPAQLFSWSGKKWKDVSMTAGDYFQKKHLGRGVATADYDNDGDTDIAVVNQNSRMALLNNVSSTGHWITFRFLGSRDNRNGIGCNVTVTQGSNKQTQYLAGGTSYCSGQELTLCFGLGSTSAPCDVAVVWPQGTKQSFQDVPVDQTYVISERRGLWQ